jgi:hypothetical protein
MHTPFRFHLHEEKISSQSEPVKKSIFTCPQKWPTPGSKVRTIGRQQFIHHTYLSHAVYNQPYAHPQTKNGKGSQISWLAGALWLHCRPFGEYSTTRKRQVSRLSSLSHESLGPRRRSLASLRWLANQCGKARLTRNDYPTAPSRR